MHVLTLVQFFFACLSLIPVFYDNYLDFTEPFLLSVLQKCFGLFFFFHVFIHRGFFEKYINDMFSILISSPLEV